MVKTEILGIEVDETKRETFVPVGAKFYLLLKKWWDIFGLRGNGIMTGAKDSIWKTSHEKLKELYPEIKEIYSVDLEDCDIVWDMTVPFGEVHPGLLINGVDWIVSQATLEHVDDPMGVMRNLSSVLIKDGLLYLHTCSPSCEEHRYPVDTYRFMRDSLIAFSTKLNLKIEDLLWTSKYCYAVYRKL
jgi:SAM-dependent methyltransferase